MKVRHGVMVGCIAVVLAGVIGFGSGCTKQQITATARQAGTAAVAAWYYASPVTPSAEIKQSVGSVATLIKSKASEVAAGGSYHQTLYPVVLEFVNVSVPEKDRLAVIIGAGWVLTGIDSFWAMNPEFADEQQVVMEATSAFCDGVLTGLGMPADAPLMKALQPGIEARRALVK